MKQVAGSFDRDVALEVEKNLRSGIDKAAFGDRFGFGGTTFVDGEAAKELSDQLSKIAEELKTTTVGETLSEARTE